MANHLTEGFAEFSDFSNLGGRTAEHSKIAYRFRTEQLRTSACIASLCYEEYGVHKPCRSARANIDKYLLDVYTLLSMSSMCTITLCVFFLFQTLNIGLSIVNTLYYIFFRYRHVIFRSSFITKK